MTAGPRGTPSTWGWSAHTHRKLGGPAGGEEGSALAWTAGSQGAHPCPRKQRPKGEELSARKPGCRAWKRSSPSLSLSFPLGTHGTIVSLAAGRGSGPADSGPGSEW